jgi:hypothetical protein
MSPDDRRFLCAPGLKIDAQARLTELQFAQLQTALSKIESTMDRLEKRLWITVYGVVGAILANAILSILKVTS